MSSPFFRIVGASLALFLWMSTLVAPLLMESGEDMLCLTEMEHSEQGRRTLLGMGRNHL